MSEKKRNNKEQDFELHYDGKRAEPPALLPRPPHEQTHKKIRKVSPLGFRVMVRICQESNVTDSGLYLPEGAKLAMQESVLAQVLEVASATDSDTEEETNVSGIPFGAIVLVAKTTGVKIPWDENLRIIDTREVLAIVEEVEVT